MYAIVCGLFFLSSGLFAVAGDTGMMLVSCGLGVVWLFRSLKDAD